MGFVALAFAVLAITGSGTNLGLVIGAYSISNVTFLLVGGVVADRLSRRLVMVLAFPSVRAVRRREAPPEDEAAPVDALAGSAEGEVLAPAA